MRSRLRGSIGMVLAIGTAMALTACGSDQGPPTNPFPPDEASVSIGRTLFAQNCQTCHGAEGRGDGPAAEALLPRPADLVVHVPLHDSWTLFRFVQAGIPGTAMPPMVGTLTDDETWHVVNFLEEQFSSPPSILAQEPELGSDDIPATQTPTPTVATVADPTPTPKRSQGQVQLEEPTPTVPAADRDGATPIPAAPLTPEAPAQEASPLGEVDFIAADVTPPNGSPRYIAHWTVRMSTGTVTTLHYPFIAGDELEVQLVAGGYPLLARPPLPITEFKIEAPSGETVRQIRQVADAWSELLPVEESGSFKITIDANGASYLQLVHIIIFYTKPAPGTVGAD